MEMIGKILGNRYEILEKIGSGGMATVYKAKCRLLNRKVAIKILRDEFANDSEFIKRFQIEAQAAASLSHPNIVSIYDVGHEDGMHYIVMELIEGETLKEVITREGKLPWRDAVKIAAQIASGLEQAHSNHIVHRDIKPHNIIITKNGTAKVTDFGIAKAVSNSTINAFGSTIGSVHYFSPEHARGGYTDEKSDIYSLGVVLYEMITGKLPFDAETPVSVALKHLQEVPKEPKEITYDIPDGLNDIIIKAMQKDVNDRYSSATAMYNDLQKILKTPEKRVDTTDYGNVEFPTQKIPIVGVNKNNNIDEDILINMERKSKFIEDEDMGERKKKKLTKSQAILRLFIFIIIAVGLFFGAFTLAVNLAPVIFGTPTTTVPPIVGLHKDEAERVLAESNLKMEIQSIESSSEVAKDYVISQVYAEGYSLKQGATVGVKISKGFKTVLVPDVTTLSIEAAKIEIEKNDLVFKQAEETSNTVPVGSIIRQSPVVNEEVEIGAEVTVYVSSGAIEGMVEVPDVMGETEAKASQKLIDARLVPVIVYAENKAKTNGTVLSQVPEAKTHISELSEITIVVNKIGSNDTTDPDEPTDPEKPSTGKRTITIDLTNKGKRDTFEVRVEVQGQITGTRIEYEKTHSRSDGKITVPISETGSGIVRVFIDDELDSEQVLNKQQ